VAANCVAIGFFLSFATFCGNVALAELQGASLDAVSRRRRKNNA